MLSGYFITPSNKIIDTKGLIHMSFICNNPEMFGFKLSDLIGIFNKHNEPIGSEGHARTEIFDLICEKGFVIVRQLQNSWLVFGRGHSQTTNKIKYSDMFDIIKLTDHFPDITFLKSVDFVRLKIQI